MSDQKQSTIQDIENRLDGLERTIANFGGAEYTNLSFFSKPIELLRSLRLLDVTPTQITSNQNDYSIGDSPAIRLSSDASRNITGIQNGKAGRLLLIINIGSQNIVLKDEDTGSVAANRIACAGSVDLTLNGDDAVFLWYDVTSLRWRTIFN